MADKKLRLDARKKDYSTTSNSKTTQQTCEGWVGGASQSTVDGNKNKLN